VRRGRGPAGPHIEPPQPGSLAGSSLCLANAQRKRAGVRLRVLQDGEDETGGVENLVSGNRIHCAGASQRPGADDEVELGVYRGMIEPLLIGGGHLDDPVVA
jgi:hypothetical protein